MRGPVVESTLERLSRILARRWDVKVIFKHDTCRTDGKTIFIPPVPDDAPPELIDATHGYLDHETAHVVFTDFTALADVMTDQRLHAVTNALEDARVERKFAEVWRGAAGNLASAHTWLLHKQMTPLDDKPSAWEQMTPFWQFVYAMTSWACAGFQWDGWPASTAVDVARVRTAAVADIVREAAHADNTADVIACARRILQQFDADASVQPESEPDAADATLPSLARALLEATRDLETPTQRAYSVYTTQGDDLQVAPFGDDTRLRTMRAEVRDCVGAVRHSLRRGLLVEAEARWEGGHRRGRLDPRAVHRVVNGTSDRVFRRRVSGRELDAAVVVMVDHSDSMKNIFNMSAYRETPLQLAAKTSLVVGDAMQQLGVPFAVYGFTTGASQVAIARQAVVVKDDDTSGDIGAYTRWGDLRLTQYKAFSEDWRSGQLRVAAMADAVGYNTYDGESLRWAARLLLERPETKKVILWLNDGAPCPNSTENHGAHCEYARISARLVESAVDVVAVGIMTRDVRNYYKRCVVVNNISDLPTVCLTELTAALRRELDK